MNEVPAPLPADTTRLRRRAGEVLQLALLAVVAWQFQLEGPIFHRQIMPLALGGFLVHSLLPQRLRLGFFVALSLVGAQLALGFPDSLWFLGLGLLLIVLCRLPAPLSVRLAALAALVAVLTLLRTGRIAAPWAATVLPVLASMFMFRVIVYLYDLEHQKRRAGVQETLAYFFMLPNVAFPVFPVVDFASFRRGYDEGDAHAIHQKGLRWMLWGIVQLLVHRCIHHFWVIAPEDVTDLATLAQHAAANYLLFLRVSGQYTLAVGMLHLFGFNLPPVVERFLLAGSFTELWRSINSYWRDFMQKIVFFPAYFPLRARNPGAALVISTALVFVVTWLLHAYQWFWIRGSYLLSGPDVLFWVLNGVGVTAAAVWEARAGARRKLGTTALRLRDVLARALRVLWFFALMCVLWSLWSSPSVADWTYLWLETEIRAADVLRFLPVALGAYLVFAAAIFVYDRAGRRAGGSSALVPQPAILAVCLLLAAAGTSLGFAQPGRQSHDFLRALSGARLNFMEMELLTRGYYEELNAFNQLKNTQLWEIYQKRQQLWPTLRETPAARATDTFLGDEIVPSVSIDFHGAPLSTNRWAMRDRDYEHAKPAGAYRIAMLGASSPFGSGVGDGEPFEAVLEQHLNAETQASGYAAYEVLNFSVPGYSPLQQLALLEAKALEFEPDAVMLVANTREDVSSTRHVASAVARGIEIPYPFLREIAQAAHVGEGASFEEAQRRLKRHGEAMLRQAYALFVERCRERGALPVYVYMPLVQEFEGNPAKDARLLALARQSGFLVIDISRAFAGHEAAELRVAEWDWHPNPLGHRLLADHLFAALRENGASLGLKLAERH